jgi:hypothetical protein
MRLPFLQVSQEEMARARTLAGYLSVPFAHALGMTVALKASALESAPAGDVSGVISDPNPAEWMAVQCGWPIDRADALAGALVRCGFAIAGPSGGYAVAGMEPYAKALDTSGKRSEAGRRGAQERWGRQKDGPAMAPNAKTQTQKDSSASQGAAAASPAPVGQASLLDVEKPTQRGDVATDPPEKPKRAPNTSALAEFIDWARAEVKHRLPPDALDPAAGMKQHERVRLGEAVKDHGLECLKAAFRLFMGWNVAQSKGYSVGFFANQWEGWVRQAKAPVAQVAATTPKGSPDDERARALREAVAAARAKKTAGGAQ